MSNVVLVTGGARRLGRGVVERFLEDEWTVLVHYHRSVDRARDLAENPLVERYRADLTDPEERNDLVAGIRDRHDGLDALINNAALFRRTILEELDRESWDRHLDLNAWVPAVLVRDLSPLLIARGGSVVNVLDWSTRRPYPAYLAYQASKGALETLTGALARHLAPEVRVNGIAPGPIEFPDDADDDRRSRILSRTLLEREGRRDEIAEAVRFLVQQATYTTGSVLDVDGGRHLT